MFKLLFQFTLFTLVAGAILDSSPTNATPIWANSGNPIQGGWEDGGSPQLPVCKATDAGGTQRPGKYVSGRCNITVHGQGEISQPSQGLLVDSGGAKYSWLGINDVKTPGWKRLYTGMSDGAPLFFCRSKHYEHIVLERGMHPGELSGMECRYGYGGKREITRDDEFSDFGTLFNSPFHVLYVPRPQLNEKEITEAEAALTEIDDHWRNQHGFLNIYGPDNPINDNENPTLFTAEYIFLLKQLGLLEGERRENMKNWAIEAVGKIRVAPGLFVRIPEDRFVDRDIECTRIFSRDEMIGLIAIDYAFDYELGLSQEIYDRGKESGWLFDNRTWRQDGTIGDVCTHGQWHSASSVKAIFDSYRTPKFQGLVAAATGNNISDLELAEVVIGLNITANRDVGSTSGKIMGMMRAEIFAQSDNDTINKAYAIFMNNMYNQYGDSPLVGMFEIYFGHTPNHPIHTLVALYDH